METALHSHGLRGDWKMDGAMPITPAIPIGESFSYELKFPDTGVFWYHPHVREDYQLTVKQGEISRVFITNVANTRTFSLEFSGAVVKLVGGDIGRIEKENITNNSSC